MKSAAVVATLAGAGMGRPGMYEDPYPVVDPIQDDYKESKVVPDTVDPYVPDYKDPKVVPDVVEPYVPDEYMPSDVVPDTVDPYPSGYEGDYKPPKVYPDDVDPVDWDDDDYDADFYDWEWGALPEPYETNPVGDPCDLYDDTDYAHCAPVDPIDQIPICEPIHETIYDTVIDGEPACITETYTQSVEEVCETTTICHTETVYETDLCEPVYETVWEPEATHTPCAGDITADPMTYYNTYFEYENVYVHPTTYTTSTTTMEPEPTIKTEYETTTYKVTATEYTTKYVTETTKYTPTSTTTKYEGTTTVPYYETIYPEPVYVDVWKTIYVPKGCVEVVPIDIPDVCDKVYPDDVVPVYDGPSYGGDAVVPDSTYPDDVDPIYDGPSYGDAVVPDSTGPYDGPSYGDDVVPIDQPDYPSDVVPIDQPDYTPSKVVADDTYPVYEDIKPVEDYAAIHPTY